MDAPEGQHAVSAKQQARDEGQDARPRTAAGTRLPHGPAAGLCQAGVEASSTHRSREQADKSQLQKKKLEKEESSTTAQWQRKPPLSLAYGRLWLGRRTHHVPEKWRRSPETGFSVPQVSRLQIRNWNDRSPMPTSS